ncbi:hypothetical protein ACFLTY_04665 [Chloroflexota bacterium]
MIIYSKGAVTWQKLNESIKISPRGGCLSMWGKPLRYQREPGCKEKSMEEFDQTLIGEGLPVLRNQAKGEKRTVVPRAPMGSGRFRPRRLPHAQRQDLRMLLSRHSRTENYR